MLEVFFHSFNAILGKRQPSGKSELKKCISHMFNLRNKIQGQSLSSKHRAVSGRMITDLEMNGTYRGAVEVFNLCRHNRKNDVLFAECTRTFGTIHLDGRTWQQRFKTECANDSTAEAHWELLLPKTKRPHLRSNNSRPNAVDVYGVRPLESPFKLLSPYEFYVKWKAVPLLSPYQYDGKTERHPTKMLRVRSVG